MNGGVGPPRRNGSVGAALGAGIGAGIFESPEAAFTQHELIRYLEPKNSEAYEPLYAEWKSLLNKAL